jgi:hypothetical protein
LPNKTAAEATSPPIENARLDLSIFVSSMFVFIRRRSGDHPASFWLKLNLAG